MSSSVFLDGAPWLGRGGWLVWPDDLPLVIQQGIFLQIFVLLALVVHLCAGFHVGP